MVPLARILLPVDLSDRSLVAARQAQVLARHFHSEVTVLHVVDPQEQEFGRFEPGGVKGWELESLLARDFTGASIRQIVCDGDPGGTILKLAGASHADLIMMASHGHGPFHSFLMGSVSAEVLREASCPVWITAHGQPGPPPLFRNVLCAVDLGPRTESAIDWAAGFAAEFMAQLSVVHVLHGFDSRDATDAPDDWLSAADHSEIGWIRRKLGKESGIVFVGGSMPEAICSQAAKLRADLLVIGRSPKADDVGAARTASFMTIHESPCPVVCI
jgi:nucleotide-binding universal stress UspA family protein